jgi:hypothetical protein
MRKIKINNIRLQNYLEERGIRPIYEDYKTEAAVYRRSKELIALLESYEIVKCAVSNGR